jgi:hypothetical protein
MELPDFRLLLTPAGQEALQAAEALKPREADFLRLQASLSRRYPAGLARAALETAILRLEAAVKFPQANHMYFTRPALEQASGHAVAAYRAGRYRGCARAIDLGCSIGGDTLALAEALPTTGLDRDPLRLGMAQANAAAQGMGERTAFVQADLLASLPLAPDPGTALFFDPARRADGRRIYTVRDYHPPLAVIDGWLPRFPALGVKLSPGVDLAELQGYPAEIEFISVSGELKEAVLWFGPLKSAARRATLLPGPHTLTAGEPARLPLDEPRPFIYEPDPAVLRAGLVAELGLQLGAAQLDADIAYLTAETRQPTPFARAWAVEDWFPFGLKRLRTYLRERGVGRVVVKKRGSPLQPEALIHSLRLSGEAGRVVFLTHLRGRPIVVIAFAD